MKNFRKQFMTALTIGTLAASTAFGVKDSLGQKENPAEHILTEEDAHSLNCYECKLLSEDTRIDIKNQNSTDTPQAVTPLSQSSGHKTVKYTACTALVVASLTALDYYLATGYITPYAAQLVAQGQELASLMAQTPAWQTIKNWNSWAYNLKYNSASELYDASIAGKILKMLKLRV